jgi:hypothetical protein
MTTPYAPSCPACRAHDPATFYTRCGGCQARKARIEAQRLQTQPLTKDQVEGMDSTMQPLEKK